MIKAGTTTMKIGVELDHDVSLAAYTAAGHGYPVIPEGKNTVWYHFTTIEGLPAVILNQTGHVPTAGDNEQQVNGCSLIVALDAPSASAARAALDRWLDSTLTP